MKDVVRRILGKPNRRVCVRCRESCFYGSSPYGATCLGCGYTDPRALTTHKQVADMVAQRVLAALLLASAIWLVCKVLPPS